MIAFLLRRAAAALLLLYLILTVTFLLLHAAPGDPTALLRESRVPKVQRDQLRQLYGLDLPLSQQYFVWLRSVVLRFDWGTSFVHQRPVTRVIAETLPNTILLATSALIIEYGAAFLFGIVAARRRGRFADQLIRWSSLLLFSLPLFWLGLIAILLFSYVWPILPASHMQSVGAGEMSGSARSLDLLRHLLLPATVLGLASAGGTARFVRNSLIEVMGQEYVQTARAKGLSELRVVWMHGIRNVLLPLLQLLAISFPALLNGSLITEAVFSWPGMGNLTLNAVFSRDYPLILATTALSGALVVLGGLVADLLNGVVDPRVIDA